MRETLVAAIQMRVPGWDREVNVEHASRLVREAATAGANIVVLPELFELPYFCTEMDTAHFALARPFDGNETIANFAALARELGVVLPVSFFERAGQAFFNTVAIIDADGTVLGRYRKTHIPDGPGYSEKYYFTPGDTGFQVWPTRFGRIGVGICWDQWFPEAARAMVLAGAELLIYPTAIGSEPQDPALDSSRHWQRTMQGHAAANLTPVLAANRIGAEQGRDFVQTYYGNSFICDETGGMLEQAGPDEECVLIAEFELEALAVRRAGWGLFRDRRPEAYGLLATADGESRASGAWR